MAALKPTGFVGQITWLGVVPDRDRQLQAEPVAHLRAGFDGPEGEAHGGLTRPACSRVKAQYLRDTVIRNTRQFSIMGSEDLAQIAERMGLAALDPALLGTTMVIAGLPDFSHLPPSSRLQGANGPRWWWIWRIAPACCPENRSRRRIRGLGQSSRRRHMGGVG